MAQTVKASELEQEAKDRITGEVVNALSFLGTELPKEEIRRRCAAILARPDIDDLIRPLFIRPGIEKAWIAPAVPIVMERVLVGDDIKPDVAPPPPPLELDQADAPDAPPPPNAAPPPRPALRGLPPAEIDE